MADSNSTPPTTYMTTREADNLAEALSQYSGKNSLATRIAIMERHCSLASRLIRAMRRQTHDSDVFALPPEA